MTTKIKADFDTHAEIMLAQGSVVAGKAELHRLRELVSKLDRQLTHLDREPSSENRELARSEARREAYEQVTTLKADIEQHLGDLVAEARAKLLSPERMPSDELKRLRFVNLLEQIGSRPDLDQTMVRVMWSSLTTEIKDALLAAPPRFAKMSDGLLTTVELVDDELRELEMRERRPQQAVQVDGLERDFEILIQLANGVEKSLTNGDGR